MPCIGYTALLQVIIISVGKESYTGNQISLIIHSIMHNFIELNFHFYHYLAILLLNAFRIELVAHFDPWFWFNWNLTF